MKHEKIAFRSIFFEASKGFAICDDSKCAERYVNPPRHLSPPFKDMEERQREKKQKQNEG